MTLVWEGIGVLLFALLAFIWWRYTSVARGARQRDEKLLQFLDPIEEKLRKKHPVSAEVVQSLARQPQFRPMLYAMLKHFERLDLFPQQYLDKQSQAEATLAYWLMHPNEFRDAPEAMELAEKVSREPGSEMADFFVFRFRMAPGHWAADEGWQLGVAGPLIESDVPYSGVTSAFARGGDKEGEVQPAELVDWYIKMLRKKID
jgi:hypothetical protein